MRLDGRRRTAAASCVIAAGMFAATACSAGSEKPAKAPKEPCALVTSAELAALGVTTAPTPQVSDARTTSSASCEFKRDAARNSPGLTLTFKGYGSGKKGKKTGARSARLEFTRQVDAMKSQSGAAPVTLDMGDAADYCLWPTPGSPGRNNAEISVRDGRRVVSVAYSGPAADPVVRDNLTRIANHLLTGKV